jgi:hypothetical protein
MKMSKISDNTPLKDLSTAEMYELIQQGIADGVANHQCRFNCLDPMQARHAVEAIEEIGNSDYEAGLKIARDNHKMLHRVREVGGKVAVATVISLGIGAVTGLGALAWKGFSGGE